MSATESRICRSSTTFALIAALAAASGRADAAPATYRLDPVHTRVIFFASHLGFSKSIGTFGKVDGRFTYDEDDPKAATVEATIDVKSLHLGDDAWEKKTLRDFFAVEKHPTARFVGTSFDGKILTGELTLRGITKPVELDVTVNRVGRHSFSMQHVAGFSATGTIKRSDFGMKRLLPAVGDEVDIRLEVEGIRE